MAIERIFEDDYIIAVNKPNDLLVHPSHYARNIKGPTLVDILQNELSIKLYPIHRLDRKTSGVILFGKSSEAARLFQDKIQDNTLEKVYYAIVRGHSLEKGIIDTPCKNDDTGVYKDALTHYETLNNITLPIPVHPYPTSRYSLLKLIPKTGRMHQLRKHMNKISHPIVGDYKYGDRFHNRMFTNEFDHPYLCLHAYSLTFVHPVSEENVTLTATPPPGFINLLERFSWALNN